MNGQFKMEIKIVGDIVKVDCCGFTESPPVINIFTGGNSKVEQKPKIKRLPRIFKDGLMWCVLLGDDLQDGVAGFGATPNDAYADFEENLAK